MKKQLGTDFFYIIFFVKTKGLIRIWQNNCGSRRIPDPQHYIPVVNKKNYLMPDLAYSVCRWREQEIKVLSTSPPQGTGTGIRHAHFFSSFFFSKLLSIDILKNNEHFCIKIIYLTVGKACCLCRWWRTVDVTRLEKDRVFEIDRTGGWRGVGRAGDVLRSCLPPQGQDGPGNKFLNYCYILAYFQFKTFILYSKAISAFSTIASHF